MNNQRIHIFISGKVQGVFFRQAMKVMAIKNNVTGWVRNLEDGRVEAILEGNAEKVDSLVEWAHTGPANARVKNVKIFNESYSGCFTDFSVLY